jgi:hypothetical protein
MIDCAVGFDSTIRGLDKDCAVQVKDSLGMIEPGSLGADSVRAIHDLDLALKDRGPSFRSILDLHALSRELGCGYDY